MTPAHTCGMSHEPGVARSFSDDPHRDQPSLNKPAPSASRGIRLIEQTAAKRAPRVYFRRTPPPSPSAFSPNPSHPKVIPNLLSQVLAIPLFPAFSHVNARKLVQKISPSNSHPNPSQNRVIPPGTSFISRYLRRFPGLSKILPRACLTCIFGGNSPRMHLECHAALGWIIANIGANQFKNRGTGAPTADSDDPALARRVRNYTVIGAILPDIDALPFLFGPFYYGLYHHTFGHNVFLWMAFAAWGVKRFHSWRAGALGFIAFGSHLLTDAYMSNWFLYLFWPLSGKGFLPANSLELSSPVNTWLLYSIPLWIISAALIWKRTPLEWISPTLDRVFISFFRVKTGKCFACNRGANIECQNCQRPICPRHLQVKRKWVIHCPECAPPKK